jgi:hypothetical protein
MSIYYGIEAEGRFKGLPTIFSSRVCIGALEQAREHKVTHICFGVRGHSITVDEYNVLVDFILTGAIPEDWIITIHQDIEDAPKIPMDVWNRCHKILYMQVDNARMLSDDVEIKLEDRLTAAVYGNPQIVQLHYVRDKEITREDGTPA